MSIIAIRNEALHMLEGKGALLDTARIVSTILETSGFAGAVIGGVAIPFGPAVACVASMGFEDSGSQICCWV